ncbi:Pentatricopeptide repeat-containing protein [Vigna angularis]|uniref:Pentatricopeptide repeat-containing protein n=1 Tax=Phaseolus angularis TaxID=3914 RepID=A0A8T0K2W6_PHAAN|nr:Pentatricopeptide repeat-containing protein [Vigna angularis]
MSPLSKKSITGKVANLHQLRQLHAQLVLHSQHHRNHWVALLLTECTRLLAPSNYTWHIFHVATYPNEHVFTCMLRYYSQISATAQVTSFFKHMRYYDIKPDASFYMVLIKSAGKSSALLHAHLLKLGHSQSERNVITWTAMVTGHAKMGNLKVARRYFDKMPERSVVSWNAMLSGYAQSGAAQETVRLFNVMLSSGIEPDETTWVIVLSSCASLGDPCLAESIVKKQI